MFDHPERNNVETERQNRFVNMFDGPERKHRFLGYRPRMCNKSTKQSLTRHRQSNVSEQNYISEIQKCTYILRTQCIGNKKDAFVKNQISV